MKRSIWLLLLILLMGLAGCGGGGETAGGETAVTEAESTDTDMAATESESADVEAVVEDTVEAAGPEPTEAAEEEAMETAVTETDPTTEEDEGETAVVSASEPTAELLLTEVTYITESFLGSQTEESIYAGDCIVRLLNNGQMVLYGDNSFEFIPADPTGVTDCLALDENTALTGSYQMDVNLFTVDYNFSSLLMVLKEDVALETSVYGFVGERLPSGDFRGGFGFDILSSGDFGSGDVLYLSDEDLLAGAEPDGETVPPIEVVYSVNEALAEFDEPILLPPPPDYQVGATINTLSFGAVTRLPAAEAAADYQGYMSSLGWTLDDTFTEGNLIRLGFSRNAEFATVSFRHVLATTIEGFFQLSGEPWTAVPQIPLPADAQLSRFFLDQNYELPVDSDRDAIAQLYEDMSAGELAAAGWTLASSSRSDNRHALIWSRPSGQSSVGISDVSSLNKVGVTFSFNTAVPAITEVNVLFSDVGSGQVEALTDLVALHGLSIEVNDREVDEAAAVSALCDGTADLISGSPTLAAAARQQCPEGLVEFTVAQVPLVVAINQENDWARSMTTAEAIAALTTAQTWADVNPAWPDTPILRALPATDTAVYEALVNELLGGDAAALSGAANVFQFNTGFDVIWNGVSSGAGAIGFAPIDAVLENADEAAAVQLAGLAPGDAAYPLKLPLVLVTRDTTLRDSLPLAAFVGQALLPDADVAPELVGYQPVDAATQQRNEALWLEAVGE